MGSMRIISFIEDLQVVEKILRHVGLWETRNHHPANGPPWHIPEPIYDDACSQLPPGDYWLQ